MDTHFIQTPTAEPLIGRLVTTINSALSSETPVAWLLSGGSAIAIAVTVAKQLIEGESRSHLRILQVDERYGPVGHSNSNWQQLLEAGFACEGAIYRPVLHGISFPSTIETYQETITDALSNCRLRIGLFGIGPDGHTAGMLPGSVAANETKELVVGYQGPDFTRITITTPAIARLDLAVAYASGEPKRATLTSLKVDQPIALQPAQALKKATEWTVYSDVLV